MNSPSLRLLSSLLLLLILAICCTGCSVNKFIPEGQTMLSKVTIESDKKQVKASTYRPYIRQEPNARWFNLVKVPLAIYSLSGTDTTRWVNRLLQRIGESPRHYNDAQRILSREYLALALRNRGFLSAYVTDSVQTKGKRTQVNYHLHPGGIYTINRLHYDLPHDTLRALIAKTRNAQIIYSGMPCSANLLEQERNRIVQLMQNHGYYKFHKELLYYSADTIAGEKQMNLTLHLIQRNAQDSLAAHTVYRIGEVLVHVGSDDVSHFRDTLHHAQQTILYNQRLPIRPSILHHNLSITPNMRYSEQAVKQSYSNLSRLGALKYAIIRFREDSVHARLHPQILLVPNAPNTISTQLEGTNTAGDLGAAASITYANRNIFNGSEKLSIKLRSAFEAITRLEGYKDQNYLEISGEANLSFPRFMFPFLSSHSKQRIKATSELSVSYSLQNRPEFHRRITTGVWRYRWQMRDQRWQHRLDLISLNYVSMPWISETFRKEYLENAASRNSLMRYSYENLFIMQLGYSLLFNSQRSNTPIQTYQNNAYQLRLSAETAGNTLFGLSHWLHFKKDNKEQYKVFGVAYSQYAKVDIDFVKSILINEYNSIALHMGLGVSVPYGNSSIVPFEKRYFAGGANSVRGWSVRELGPGAYRPQSGAANYIAQTGNIKLDLSVEYRTKLFWKLHGAAFVDAGNIWTVRDYSDQVGGVFRFDKFYQQIAVAYGLGLRFNFDYFILRFDGGMKAVSPTYMHPRQQFPMLNPNFKRDFTLHFAVGLPF